MIPLMLALLWTLSFGAWTLSMYGHCFNSFTISQRAMYNSLRTKSHLYLKGWQRAPITGDVTREIFLNTIFLSWEIGTRETALLELNAPSSFLWASSTIPPKLLNDSDMGEVFQSVDSVMAAKPKGIPTFFSNSAVGDPASVGIPFLIRNFTLMGASPRTNFSVASAQELNYLLTAVPRTASGAISHRPPPEAVQLWADFISMAPPFIAYYGAITHNKTLVQQGYQQILAYRSILLDKTGLLRHILLGNAGTQDSGHWSTGNGWAVSGMLRVLRIIKMSPFASSMTTEQKNLITWSASIISAAWSHQQPNGALVNYIDLSPNSSPQSFIEASGTALLAACTFRLASITWGVSGMPKVNVAAAENARKWVVSQVGSDGWINNVVDPFNWRSRGSHSPEGQAFVLMLHAAYRDFYLTTGGHY